MEQKSTDLKKLFHEKKYSEIIDIIHNKIEEKDKNSGLLNLLGVCKLLNDSSGNARISAQEDFRKSYLKEKKTLNAFDALKNFINITVDVFDIEFREGRRVPEKFFDEILLYFNENKDYFSKDEGLASAIVRVFKRNLDIDNTIYYLNKLIEVNGNNLDALASLIYWNTFKGDWDQKKYLEYSKILSEKLPSYPNTKLFNLSNFKNEKINLGFLSSDMISTHSVTHFLKTVLADYDKKKINIFLYINNKKEDETTQELKKYSFKSTNISGLEDIDAINTIRNDKIDIMIDLMGLTSNHRLQLFKNRLANKQVSWCGYCNTTGLDQMDYIITDKHLVLESEENLYSEKVIKLDNIWNSHAGFSYEREFIIAPFNSNRFITFGSFNNFRKINENVIDVWSSILRNVENSKLVLKSSDVSVIDRISKKFKKNGVFNSIEFLPHKKKISEHLNEYKKIDIALDTFPYNGVTTSFEAIWMGVPVLTMKGFNFNSRCGESINKNLNLNDLIAENENDYIDKAIALTKNKKILDLRKLIYDNALKSPLFDKKKFSKQFFSLMEKIYAK